MANCCDGVGPWASSISTLRGRRRRKGGREAKEDAEGLSPFPLFSFSRSRRLHLLTHGALVANKIHRREDSGRTPSLQGFSQMHQFVSLPWGRYNWANHENLLSNQYNVEFIVCWQKETLRVCSAEAITAITSSVSFFFQVSSAAGHFM